MTNEWRIDDENEQEDICGQQSEINIFPVAFLSQISPYN
jgi:hypothetical protein